MINLIRGATKNFQIKVRGETSGDPHSFFGATEIVVSFPLAVGTLDKKLSLTQLSYPVSAYLGVVQGALSPSETLTLQVGQGQSVRLTETDALGATNIFEGQILNISD